MPIVVAADGTIEYADVLDPLNDLPDSMDDLVHLERKALGEAGMSAVRKPLVVTSFWRLAETVVTKVEQIELGFYEIRTTRH